MTSAQLPEILTMGSVDFEDASRLDFDRQRQARLLRMGLQHRVNPTSADRLFVRLLVDVLDKVSSKACRSRGKTSGIPLSAENSLALSAGMRR